ncbi:hypothetical protein HDU93_005453, partial [Gonapodya sp. JEL0774]
MLAQTSLALLPLRTSTPLLVLSVSRLAAGANSRRSLASGTQQYETGHHPHNYWSAQNSNHRGLGIWGLEADKHLKAKAVGPQGVANKAQRATVYDMIIRDHEVIRDLHQKYLSHHEDSKRVMVLKQLIREVSLHAAAEDLVIYPALSHFTRLSPSRAMIADPQKSRKDHQHVE